MSDLTTQYNDALEPDEDTLVSALRNQDDIPILMDVVAEQVAACASQEDYLVRSLDESNDKDEESSAITPQMDLSQELISKTIAQVLERRLPELVSEVMQTLYSSANVTHKE